MKDINIFKTDMFPYLEGEEIKGTTLTLTIRNMRTEELKSHKGAKENKEVLYFSETSKGFVLNKTNAKRIAQMYGAMTGHWEGKQITLTTEEVQAFGEIHNALRVVPATLALNGNGNMTLEKLQGNLDKIPRIRGFYQSPEDILGCRSEGTAAPEPDDMKGWRQFFKDARDYAFAEQERAIEDGDMSPDQVPMPQEVAIREAAADDDGIEAQYPEIFRDESGAEENTQDITPDSSGLDLPETDGISNLP